MSVESTDDELLAVRRELAAIPATATRGVRLAVEPATRIREIRIPVPFLSKEPRIVYESRNPLIAKTDKVKGETRVTVGDEAARSYASAELRGVLAHEVAHISLGHLDRSRMSGRAHVAAGVLHPPQTALCGAVLALYLASKGWAVAALLAFATGLAAWIVGVAISQRQEHAADALAVTWVGACMLNTVTRMKEREEPFMQRLHLHSHPPYQQRIDRLQNALRSRARGEGNS